MSSLRVIAGSARGRRLHAVPGEITRPITDRTKESLFNILGADIFESAFLDLFAGTGSVGIEALSRGAEFALFVDHHPAAIKTIQRNLDETGLGHRARVVRKDAFKLLDTQPERHFDYVYIAPPQYRQLWERAVKSIDANPDWLSEDAWMIVQIDPVEYSPQAIIHLKEFEQRRYGSTLLIFYEVLD
jgi:16S rRNA (guanine(966)-N(2))-methyltransferase RsmD